MSLICPAVIHGSLVRSTSPVYDRRRLGAGASLAGPAIIEERESTAVIGPGGRVRVDGRLNLVAAVGGAQAGGGGAGR